MPTSRDPAATIAREYFDAGDFRRAAEVVTHVMFAQRDQADAALTTTRRALPAPTGGLSSDELAAAGIEVTGDASVLARLAAVLDPGDKNVAIVTP